jgi:HK97 family phage major capsid protein
MDLEKLREEYRATREKARAIQDVAESEAREFTREEALAFDDAVADAETQLDRINRELKLRNLEEEGAKPSRGVVAKPGDEGHVPGNPTRFRSFGEQMQAVMRAGMPGGHVDPRLLQSRASTPTGLSEGSAVDGGFLVQTDFTTELLQNAYDTGLIAPRCRKIPISGNANGIKINGISETSRADGSRWGGVQAFWTAEGNDKTGSKPKFRQIELNLKKIAALVYATDELLQDAAALEAVIRTAVAEEFGFKLDDAFYEGDGSGKPLGVMNSPALVSVAKETGQAADTIVLENIVNMWSRMPMRSRMNAVWHINQDVEPQLFGMTMSVGVGGVPVYLPPGGISGTPYSTLFGRPVLPLEQASAIGDKGDILLADWSQYMIADKGAMQSAQSIHVRFVQDESVFRFVYRVDGAPIWQSALTPFKSSQTQSPFVTLDAR